jgi:hypothetical protein
MAVVIHIATVISILKPKRFRDGRLVRTMSETQHSEDERGKEVRRPPEAAIKSRAIKGVAKQGFVGAARLGCVCGSGSGPPST